MIQEEIFECKKHGIWHKEVYPNGCPLCLADQQSIKKEVKLLKRKYGRL